VASLAIGALTLSALQTQGADFTQTNLVSDIQGLAKITIEKSLGCLAQSDEPLLDFKPRNRHGHALRRH
jgi:hypothetical protein